MSDQQIFILEHDGSKNPLYTSWSQALSVPFTFVEQYATGWMPPANCALLVSAQHYREPEFSILRRAVELAIPTLIIADGILAYRNTWENPEIAAGCMFQPLIGHKIACLGRSQVRVLESWGNLGKCELVGSPRMDSLLAGPRRERETGKPCRILVMTAKKLGFTAEQVALTKRSIRDLKYWFSQHPRTNGTELQVVWRLTQDLDKEIGVQNNLSGFEADELEKILKTVDAVVTAPSTSMLEAMLQRVPVALVTIITGLIMSPRLGT